MELRSNLWFGVATVVSFNASSVLMAALSSVRGEVERKTAARWFHRGALGRPGLILNFQTKLGILLEGSCECMPSLV